MSVAATVKYMHPHVTNGADKKGSCMSAPDFLTPELRTVITEAMKATDTAALISDVPRSTYGVRPGVHTGRTDVGLARTMLVHGRYAVTSLITAQPSRQDDHLTTANATRGHHADNTTAGTYAFLTTGGTKNHLRT
ncbi:hypothetical protein PR003_g5361 [Phytophthora rubi]|uniref:Uncharacterized protein n=1 Tax=Phytophthora rubi TaxID=129364 RepID=A0A6A4FZT9_9STRA|nr:hypothetical protein PR002_g5425 [Phytophthora rubi]KAE9045017.1 hypothetical protein PR001_g5141 [Phytophthora rubi]KAE9350459.1 hypothetical protein PR003_g5361 [Phytophthora rubi]